MITALNLLNRGPERHALEFREAVPSGAVEVFDKVFGCAAQAGVIIQRLEPRTAQHHAPLVLADYLPDVTVRQLDKSVQVRRVTGQSHEPPRHAE